MNRLPVPREANITRERVEESQSLCKGNLWIDPLFMADPRVDFVLRYIRPNIAVHQPAACIFIIFFIIYNTKGIIFNTKFIIVSLELDRKQHLYSCRQRLTSLRTTNRNPNSLPALV